MAYQNKTREELIEELELLKLKLDSAETQIKEELSQKDKYRSLIENINEVVYEVTDEGVIRYVSPSIARILEYTPEELTGKYLYDLVIEADRQIMADRLTSHSKPETTFHDYRFLGKSGKIIWLRKSTKEIVANGEFISKIGTLTDVSQQKFSEIELHQSEARYKTFFENNASVMLLISPLKGEIMDANMAACKFYGWRHEELCSMNISDINQLSKEEISQEMHKAREEKRKLFQFRHRLANGDIRDVEVYSGPLKFGSTTLLYSVIHDITERRKAEEEILKANRLYAVISQINQSIIHINNREELLNAVCNVAIESGKFRMAWIGMVDDETGMINPVVSKGEENGYLDYVRQISIFGGIKSQGPAATAIREGHYYICNDIEKDPHMAPWREEELKRGYYSSIGLPIRQAGKPVAVLNLYASVRQFFNESEIKLLLEVADEISYALDAIETKKVREAAETELRKFRSAIDQANYGTTIITPDGTLLYVNKAIADMHGYSVSELCGKHVSIFYNSDQMVQAERTLNLARQNGEFYAEELWHTRKDGTVFPTLMNATLINDPGGNPQFITSTAIDITNLKQKEQALWQSEENLNHAQEIANMGSWVFDLKTKEVTWSKNYYNLVGRDPALPPLSLEEIRKMVHQEDRGLFEEATDQILSSGKMATFIFRLHLPGQSMKWIQTNIAPLYEKNEIFALNGVSIDITEKILAEEEKKRKVAEIKRLSQAIEQSPILVVVTDLNGSIEYVNPAFLKTTGYSYHEVIGKNPRILKSGKTGKAVYKELWKTITADEEWQGEWINRKKNGEFYWESVSISPIHDDTGRTTSYLALKQDITQRKRTEQEILELNESLEQKIRHRTEELADTNQNLLKEIHERKKAEEDLNKARIEADNANLAKSEFLSRMSHELRTPMNSILGFAQLLEMGELTPGQKKGVSHIMKSGRHLLDLINEVLDISRIEAGRLSISIEPVQLNSIISEMMEIVKPQAIERNLTLNLISSFDTRLFVMSDRQRLKQILLNLINNAIKYNKEGGSVVIRTEKMQYDHTRNYTPVRISITDTGQGISPENLPRLFNPFERFGAEKTGTEGTGLGLAVVKKLVDAMGGNVGAESNPGTGSTFWIEMPHCQGQLERADISGIFDEPATNVKDQSGKILYIEDNSSNIELVEQILFLHRKHINLVTHSYGSQAVTLASSHEPSLVLLDLNLPDIHGSEVLANLMQDEKTRNIPVVIISADAMQPQLDRLLKAGARNYLTKPINVSELLAVIDEYIKN